MQEVVLKKQGIGIEELRIVIDGLLNQEPKLKIIYNESKVDDLPVGYDVKALEYSSNNLNIYFTLLYFTFFISSGS